MQDRRRQGRAIGVDENSAVVTGLEQASGTMEKTLSEITIDLR